MKKTEYVVDKTPHVFERELSFDLHEFPDEITYRNVGRVLNNFQPHLANIDWDKNGWYSKSIHQRHTNEKNEKFMRGYTEENTAFTHVAGTDVDQVGEETAEFFGRYRDFIGMEKGEVMICRSMPGQITPLHQDVYKSYRRRNGIDGIPDDAVWDVVGRYWMALEDWKPGHMFQSNKTVITHWKAGDIWSGPGQHPHLACNAGTSPRYFAIITGVITDTSLALDGYTEVTL